MRERTEHRLGWVDSCKGLCILLVVYGHVTGGLEAAGAVAAGSAFDLARSWVYLFHMPAFFFLSGLFAAKALERPLDAFLAGKLRTLVYPYVLWTGIYLAAQELMARYTNNPPDPAAALRLAWEPYGYGLWFLYSLFLIAVLFHLLQLARPRREAVLVLAILLHLAAAYNLFAFWPILNTALLNFIFYAVAGLYSGAIFSALVGLRPSWAALGGTASLVLMTLAAVTLGRWLGPFAVILSLLGVAGVVGLARAMEATPAQAVFAFLGFYSLEIYLGHPLFSTVTRAILTRVAPHDVTLCLAGCVAGGVVGSLVPALIFARLRFPYLYRWPSAARPRNILVQPEPVATS